ILASKYIQTLDGVLPLKILCPRNYFGKTKVHLQKTLANLFEKHSGFSDQQISTLLKKQGINIARRTVTKYRNMLEIKSSLHRSQG
ncbi:RNA polymerase sigma-54 factor, partial [bacterium]|nr:RNA polymerase sigma-54 factor [bacterium]